MQTVINVEQMVRVKARQLNVYLVKKADNGSIRVLGYSPQKDRHQLF